MHGLSSVIFDELDVVHALPYPGRAIR